MTATVNLQQKYECETCKHAENSSGHNCRYGMMFPILLLMAGEKLCPNYIFDRDKLKERQEENG